MARPAVFTASADAPTGRIRTILTDENPLLRTPSDVADTADPELDQDIADLAETLRDFRERAGFGRAISAPQIGIMKRLIVMNFGAGPIAMVNPTIVDKSAETQMVWDDCLSVPGRLVQVERSEQISLTYHNRAGTMIDWADLPPDLSELLQHECDHLDGVLMTDRADAPESIRPLDERATLVPTFGQPGPRISAPAIAAGTAAIDPVFLNSPQYECEPLSEFLGCRVTLKVETLNPIRCFKGRGASLLISDHVATNGPHAPVISASAGNWGQAVGYACRANGTPFTVFAAETANPAKLERMRALGAEVVLTGTDFDAAKAAAKMYAADQSLRFVEDGQDTLVTVGHGSMAVELFDAVSATGDHLDAVIVPTGNGAMINGVGYWAKAASPATAVVGVTPTGAPAMHSAWRAPDQPETWETDAMSTIADGLAVRVPVPDAVDDMVGVVDDVIPVNDDAIRDAMSLLHRTAGLVTEPAGAAGIAAIAANRARFEGRHVAVVICGSNVAPDHLHLFGP